MSRGAFYRHERDDQPIVGDPSWEGLVGILGVGRRLGGVLHVRQLRWPQVPSQDAVAARRLGLEPRPSRRRRDVRQPPTRCGRCNGWEFSK